MYYFIVNPKSSSGRGGRIFQELRPLLDQAQVPYQVHFTKSGQDAAQTANKICREKAPCTILAVGGDGTANDVLNGLCNFDSILFGYLPTGSGNDLARGLSLTADPKKALSSFLSPTKVVPLSVGVAESPDVRRRFLVSSGIGFDADVCFQAQHSRLKAFLNRFRLGKLTYVGLAIKSLYAQKTASITLSLDQQPPIHKKSFYFTAAMNLKYEGGGFMFCPDASPTDRFLDLILVEKMPRLKILALLPTAFFGKHTRFRGISIHRFQKATLTVTAPMVVHTDGEPQGYHTSLSFYLEEKPLPFILG